MYDTETDELVQRDIITKKHQSSVLWLNGHSGAISRRHYIAKKKDEAISDGRYVMNLILNKGRDRESHVDDASRDDSSRRGQLYDDNRVDDSEIDCYVDQEESFDGSEGDNFDYEDNNDDMMYQQCDYEYAEEEKWHDDAKYGRDQDKVCASNRYSHQSIETGDDSRFIRIHDDDSSVERGGSTRIMHRSYISPHTETDLYAQRRRTSDAFGVGTRANNTKAIPTTSLRRHSMDDDGHKRTHDYDSFIDDDLEVLSETDLYAQRRRTSDAFVVGTRANNTKAIPTTSLRRRSMDDDDLEVLSPLPLRMTREAYVNWTDAEIEYTRKAYDIIHAQLPLDQRRFISKAILQHIRNDPMAKLIFHPSHLENSAKFRHVIRRYVQT
jgi:hypothetical protein